MQRRVFIICAPLNRKKHEPFSEGVQTDAINYYNYFTAPMGGGFYASEITILENAQWVAIRKSLLLNPADYTVVIFSGHGYMGVPSMKTTLKINQRETVTMTQISDTARTPRLLFIVDSCRNYYTERDHFNFIGEPYISPYMEFNSNMDVETAREIVESNVLASNVGIQVLYSCAPNESSAITESGSHFTKALLESSRAWAQHSDNSQVLTGAGALKFAAYYIKSKTQSQSPQLKVYNGANFPFAVKHPTYRQYGFHNHW